VEMDKILHTREQQIQAVVEEDQVFILPQIIGVQLVLEVQV
tara:strand:- start:9 stop:131 length:123 start_codon:yes stop_codon:yes gene_type:complete